MSPAPPTPAHASRALLPRRTVRALAAPDGVVVPLDALLSHARPAYGGRTWAGAIPALMAADAGWARTVHDLVDELRLGRPILNPVWVHRRRGQPVRDGMHRIAAHVLAGAATIPASTAPPGLVLEIVELHMRLAPRTAEAHAVLEGPDGDLLNGLDLLRSLRAGSAWAWAESISTCGDVGSCANFVPHTNRDALVRAVSDRAAELGFSMQLDGVTLSDTSR